VKRYEVLNLSDNDNFCIIARCTDPEVLQFITTKVKEFRPESQGKAESIDAAGVVYQTIIENCGFERHRQPVIYWLFRHFCHQGWKPTVNGLILEVEVE
jgi:hypothetical protein